MKTGKIVWLLVGLGVPLPASAAGMALECKTKATAEEKLACMSAVALSPWLLNERASKFDDSQFVQAATRARDVAYSGIGDNTATLVFQCEEGRTAVFIDTKRMMVGKSAKVSYRIGDRPVHSEVWRMSDDRHAVGLWQGKDAIPFIKALQDNDLLIFRIENRARLEGEFRIGDVSRIARTIGSACKWP